MTPIQFDRWKDFAIRMAKTCFKLRQSPDESWIVNQVEGFFDYEEIKGYFQYFVDWDHSLEMPGGESAGHVCDHASEMADYVWGCPEQHATPKELALLDEYWTRNDFESRLELKEKIASRYESPVHCCLRAGLDLAAEPSAGVQGFTVGDLRRMYPEGVPNWVSCEWNRPFDEMTDDAGLWL